MSNNDHIQQLLQQEMRDVFNGLPLNVKRLPVYTPEQTEKYKKLLQAIHNPEPDE